MKKFLTLAVMFVACVTTMFAQDASDRKILRSNFNPNGEKFQDKTTIDWNTQKVYARIKLDQGHDVAENILSVGSGIERWRPNGHRFHFYYNNGTIQTNYVTQGAAGNAIRNDKAGFAGTTVEIEISKAHGATINGESVNFNGSTEVDFATVCSDLWALTEISLGSEEGNGRSQQTIEELSIVNLPSSEVTAPTPDITIGGNTLFSGSAKVTIAAEGADAVYYTVDGTDPTTASTLYTEPFTIDATTTVKALAVKGTAQSKVVEATFTKEDYEIVNGKKVILTDYNPNGEAFEKETTIDWDTQKVYARIKLDAGQATNENILSVGTAIQNWRPGGARFHFYYDHGKIQTNYLGQDKGRTILCERDSFANTTVEIEISKANGVTINGKSANFNGSAAVDVETACSELWGKSQISVGSTQGETRSWQTIEELSIVDANVPTGVNNINANKAANNSQRYNLAGQRVDKNYRGVVIVNGRKQIVK